MRQWATETMTERVIRQLAKKFRYFDAVVSTAQEKRSIYYSLSIYDKQQQNPHRRDPTRLLGFGSSRRQAMKPPGTRSSQ